MPFAVVQNEVAVLDMGILIQMIDAIRIEQRRTALDAVHLISPLEQQFGKVGTVLTCDARH